MGSHISTLHIHPFKRKIEIPKIHRFCSFNSEENATNVCFFCRFWCPRFPKKTLYPKICPDVLKTAHKTMAYSWSRSSVAPTLASCKPVSQTVTNCKLWEFRDAFFLPLDGFIDEGCCISGPRPKNSLPSSWHLAHLYDNSYPIQFRSLVKHRINTRVHQLPTARKLSDFQGLPI